MNPDYRETKYFYIVSNIMIIRMLLMVFQVNSHGEHNSHGTLSTPLFCNQM